jgi:hypothetical protein
MNADREGASGEIFGGTERRKMKKTVLSIFPLAMQNPVFKS